MAKNTKVLTVLSTAAVTGLITAALGSTAFAKTSSILVQNGSNDYRYDYSSLASAFEDYSANPANGALYQDYLKQLGGKSPVALYDDVQKTYIDYTKVASAFEDAQAVTKPFDLNAFTESSKDTYTPVAPISDVTVGSDGKIIVTPVPVPVTNLAVSSVSAINNKQVQVTFNKAVDKTTAESVTSYVLKDASGVGVTLTGGTAKLQADGKTVIITLPGNTLTDVLTQQGSYNLAVTGVQDSTGTLISGATVNAFTVYDAAIPKALSATMINPSQIKVVYSAPIYNTGITDYLLDNGQYSIVNAQLTSTNDADDSVILTLGSTPASGAHTLTIAPSITGSAPKAYNGFSVSKDSTLSVNTTTDTSAPTVSVASISLIGPATTKVQFKFSKPVDASTAATAKYYWNYDKSTAAATITPNTTVGTSNTYGATTYYDTYDVVFNTAIPAGVNTFYVDNDADVNGQNPAATNYIKDEWGNKLVSTSVTGALTIDTAKPKVTNVALNGQSKVDVKFSKTVSNSSAQNGVNYTLKDSNGNVVTPSTLTGASLDYSGHPTAGIADFTSDASKGYYELNFGTNLKPGTYTLAVSGVQDTVYPTNTMEAQTFTLTVSDVQSPTVSQVTTNGSSNKLFVYYSKPMLVSGTGSILDPANYEVNGAALPSGTTVTAANGNTVAVLSFANSQTFTKFAIGQVKDTLGNSLDKLGYYRDCTLNPILADSIASTDVVAGSAKSTSNGTITFEVKQPLVYVNSSAITVTKVSDGSNAITSGGVSASISNQTLSDGVTYGAVVTLNSAGFTTTNSADLQVNVASNAIQNINGAKNGAAFTVGSISDKVAPVVLNAKVNNITKGTDISAVCTDGKNLVIDLSAGVDTTDQLGTVTVTTSEGGTLTIGSMNLNGTTIPGLTKSLGTGDAGSAAISLADFSATDAGATGISESKLKQLVGANSSITIPATLIDANGNSTTGTITIKGLR